MQELWFLPSAHPREITQKSINAELWFLPSARRLMLIGIYMKSRKDSLNNFQVIEPTPVWQETDRRPGEKQYVSHP